MLKVDKLTQEFPPPLSFGKLLKSGFKQDKPVKALENISFSLKKGQVLAVLGPNGAGKTTLLKIISTLILPKKGQVSVGGYFLGKNDEKIKSLLGLIMDEERSFYWRLTGKQNLEFFSSLYGYNRRETAKRITQLLELFKIDYADKSFFSYSAGMKKNFALIRGLIHSPQLLLFDEPTKSLDYLSASHLRNFIKKKLVEEMGKTVIFTTHQIDEALGFADLFMILDKGEMRAFGTLDELRISINEPAAPLNRIFLKFTQGSENA